MSVPISKEVKPEATAAAAPPEEPPGTLDGSHGLFVVPKMSLKLCRSPEKRGRLVSPEDDRAGVAHLAHHRGVVGRPMWSLSSVAPPVDRMPSTSTASFTVMGRPWSGPELDAAGERVVGSRRRSRGPVPGRG